MQNHRLLPPAQTRPFPCCPPSRRCCRSASPPWVGPLHITLSPPCHGFGCSSKAWGRCSQWHWKVRAAMQAADRCAAHRHRPPRCGSTAAHGSCPRAVRCQAVREPASEGERGCDETKAAHCCKAVRVGRRVWLELGQARGYPLRRMAAWHISSRCLPKTKAGCKARSGMAA